MMERLWHLPPRVRIQVQELDPDTGRHRIDPRTGERLWTHEDVNVVLYAVGVLYMVLDVLVYLLRDEWRAARSSAYRLERDRRMAELLERKRRQRERYRKDQS
jgi:hypothetical protein